ERDGLDSIPFGEHATQAGVRVAGGSEAGPAPARPDGLPADRHAAAPQRQIHLAPGGIVRIRFVGPDPGRAPAQGEVCEGADMGTDINDNTPGRQLLGQAVAVMRYGPLPDPLVVGSLAEPGRVVVEAVKELGKVPEGDLFPW